MLIVPRKRTSAKLTKLGDKEQGQGAQLVGEGVA